MVAAILFRPQINFMNNNDMLYSYYEHPVQIWWWSVERFKSYSILFKIQDGGSRHLVSYNGHFEIVEKGVHDFLIVLNVTSDDILHSLLTNRRNVVKIPMFTAIETRI